jgi:hypothetical protein
MHLLAVDTSGIHRAYINVRAQLDVNDFDADAVWDNLYLLIARAGNVSKVFWPADKRPRIQERADKMRKIFDMEPTSPFSARGVRNSFEHIDERIHNWMPDMVDSADPVDLYIGNSVGAAKLRQHRFIIRAFDWDNVVLTIADDSVSLRPLMHENLRIHERLCDVAPFSPAPLVSGLNWHTLPGTL